MTPDEQDAIQARLLRLAALRVDAVAAQLRMAASLVELGGAMRGFIEAWKEAEAREFADHPDLAELDLQLDGYYGAVG